MFIDDLETRRIAADVDALRASLRADVEQLQQRWPDLVGVVFRQTYSEPLADSLMNVSRELAAFGETMARISFDLTDLF